MWQFKWAKRNCCLTVVRSRWKTISLIYRFRLTAFFHCAIVSIDQNKLKDFLRIVSLRKLFIDQSTNVFFVCFSRVFSSSHSPFFPIGKIKMIDFGFIEMISQWKGFVNVFHSFSEIMFWLPFNLLSIECAARAQAMAVKTTTNHLSRDALSDRSTKERDYAFAFLFSVFFFRLLISNFRFSFSSFIHRFDWVGFWSMTQPALITRLVNESRTHRLSSKRHRSVSLRFFPVTLDAINYLINFFFE